MHRLGNDIIDLNLAKTQSNWERKGFLEKQFTEQEQAIILNSKNSFLQVWLFWSMKEAAYKCYTQEFPKRFFNPKKIICSIDSEDRNTVTIYARKFNIKYSLTKNYIHTIAFTDDDKKLFSNTFLIGESERQTLKTNKKLLNNFDTNVQLKKNQIGVPFLYQKGKKLPVSISTSHHGNYGAFAFSHL